MARPQDLPKILNRPGELSAANAISKSKADDRLTAFAALWASRAIGIGRSPWAARAARISTVCLFGLALIVAFDAPWSAAHRPGSFLRGELTGTRRPATSYVFEALWWVYGIAALAAYSVVSWSEARGATGFGRLLAPRHPILAVVPVLAILNGVSPYLGVKTETSFSMFSNLRTEGGKSNHHVVP